MNLRKLLRVYQWPKNILVFAGILFVLPESLVRIPDALWLFAAFCAASSFVYIVNDLADRKHDARHPTKRHRPIASGAISTPRAILIALLLLAIAATSIFLSTIAAIVIGVYIAFNIAYSAGLKHAPFVDLLILASGYVLRVIAGTEGLGIPLSEWMFIVTFFGALMIGTGKRYAEARDHGSRPSTKELSLETLKAMVLSSATLTIGTYAIYAQAHPSPIMLLTIIPVFTGVFGFYALLQNGGEDPSRDLFRSKAVILSGVIYGALVVLAQIPL